MVWMLLAPLAVFIAADYGLDLKGEHAAFMGLVLAVPILGGALLRLVLGVLTDRIGPRRTGLIGLTLTLVPLLLGWKWARGPGDLLVVGALLGVAGASFAAALPLASRWYPPQYQGLAMGIAGAGNSGTALATLFAPLLARAFGWQAVFGLALIPVGLMLVLFYLFAKDSPAPPAPRPLSAYADVLRQSETWWFCLFYSVTFGGFVGLASFLSTFFAVQYELSPVQAGYFATGCVIAGSFLRPVGGYLADRLGGIRLLTVLYAVAGVMLLSMASLPPLPLAAAVLFLAMGMLGMGNGAVFQLVPQRFPREIGVITGVVGAAGGVGGFFLPTVLGGLRQLTGSYAYGFPLFALVALGSALALSYVSRLWEGSFVGTGRLGARALAPPPVDAEAESPA